MGKKNKKLKQFAKQNKLLLATLGGVAAGISLAGILGTEKAKKIVDTLGTTLNDFTGKLKDEVPWGHQEKQESTYNDNSDSFPQDAEIKNRRQTHAETV